MILAQLETAIKAIDHASGQSVEWMLVAALGVLGTFGWLVIRRMARREDEREKRDYERSEASMRQLVENTEVLRTIRPVLEDLKNWIKRQ